MENNLCQNTKGKYGKVTYAEINWSIIHKSVTVVVFEKFINWLIDYLIHHENICLYNINPHKPHFYIVKLGLTGVYIIFLISAKT